MAKITCTHAGDHAAVAFTGELDWDSCRELVELVDALVGDYFYSEVELIVTSPGGRVRAFEYFLDRCEHWRQQGVRLRTRVLCEAASAGAVLVSLGDERLAEPGATLSYHCSHISPEGGVNAETTAVISSVLRDTDENLIGRLVERALAGDEPVTPDAERSDRQLLEQLWPEFGRKGRKAPCKPRKLARALGRYVDDAVSRRNRAALGRLYRRLFEVESTLSARLALTLRLIDRIGAPAPPCSRTPGAPGLTVPEWRVLYPPDGTVPRQALCRHVLVTGETGSGKTASCVLPVVAAMARAPRNALASALVIDPKRELARTLQRRAPQRVHEVKADQAVLNIMSGPRWSIGDDLVARRWVSAARRILCRVASLAPTNPARVVNDN